jgi:UDP-glucose 4-epimerase
MIEQKASCIVLGGGGFIGTNLCRRLATEGHRVRAFGRQRPFLDALEGVEWFQGDFSDAGALAAAIETFDVVYHLINGTTPLSANLDMAADLQTNVAASLGMFDTCVKLGVARVVFVSSGGTIYGCPQQIPTPETAPTDPITAYGISKLAIEKYLALNRHLHRLDYRVLRVSNPFGPFQTSIKNQGVIASIISRALRREEIEIWGDGTVVRDFIFVDDVVDALVLASHDRSEMRLFNIGCGEGRSLRDVIETIETLVGRKLDVIWKPGRPVDVPVSVVAIERARDVLGWQPRTSFQSGLEQTVAWWRSYGSGRHG